MGVKLLNKLMKKYAVKGVKIISLDQLKNKSIVVDISIYLYKYKSQNMLLTNIFKLCSVFKHYNINAIFIFDGEPDKIKQQAIIERNEQKYIAKQKYYKIIDNSTEKYIKTNKSQLIELKKSFTRIKKEDIEVVKKLLQSYGMKYYIAEKEADHVCGQLVNTYYKDGCLSDDMDMFVYKSKFVYRNLDIVNGTCLQYNLDLILKYLNIEFEDFKWMCILSNNDYNTSSKNVFEYYKLYKTYKYQQNTNKSFIDYVKSYEFMTKKQIENLNFIYNLYNTDTDCFDETNIVCDKNDNHKLHKLLEQDNFIYPPQLEVC
jgi:5'-3' exonuclease